MNLKGIFEKGRIDTKAEFYSLYNLGLLGNKVLTWNSPGEIYQSGWKGKVCIRARNGISRGNTRYNIPLENLDLEIEDLESRGFDEGKLTFNQSMPDSEIVLQGEVRKDFTGWDLHYSLLKKPMNLALAEESYSVSGLRAKLLLENSLTGSSFSDLEGLFDVFPNSVVEFSAYSKNVGNIRGRNAVIWEVRNY